MPYVTTWERLAREEGKQESYKEMAKKLIKKGIDLKTVAETTGLSLKQIKALIPLEGIKPQLDKKAATRNKIYRG
jgi:hypothetical protein